MSVMVLQGRKSSPQKSRPPESGHRRHGVWIAIEYSYKLGQKKEIKFLCVSGWFSQIQSHIWQKGSTRQLETMALVRTLYFCAARFDIHVMTTHIAGTTNAIADALSRLQVGSFKQLIPNAADLPDPIPAWPTQYWTDCLFSTYH